MLEAAGAGQRVRTGRMERGTRTIVAGSVAGGGSRRRADQVVVDLMVVDNHVGAKQSSSAQSPNQKRHIAKQAAPRRTRIVIRRAPWVSRAPPTSPTIELKYAKPSTGFSGKNVSNCLRRTTVGPVRIRLRWSARRAGCGLQQR